MCIEVHDAGAATLAVRQKLIELGVADPDWHTVRAGPDSMTFVLYDKRQRVATVAGFTLTLLPGCKNIGVSHNASVAPAYRNLGLGTVLHELRQQILRYWGCQYIMATNDEDNEAQRKILKKFRWLKLFSFKNYLTQHVVALRVKSLSF